jgi:hypothetical protein
MVTDKSLANLKPFVDSKDAKEKGSRGGKASVQARLRKKSVKECLKALLDMPISDDKCEKFGLEPGTTYAAGMALKGAEGFLDGNPAMARLMLELLGESKQEVNINGALPVVIHDDVTE